jgi:hypothetical protein
MVEVSSPALIRNDAGHALSGAPFSHPGRQSQLARLRAMILQVHGPVNRAASAFAGNFTPDSALPPTQTGPRGHLLKWSEHEGVFVLLRLF